MATIQIEGKLIDSTLNKNSHNAVENAAIAEKFEELENDISALNTNVSDDRIVKKIFFNMSSSATSPNYTLSHDILPENNKVGFLFGPPLIAMFKTYDDPQSDEYVKTIQVAMPDATTARNGYMTKTQAGQLSSLYTSHGNKSYLPLSGGTVTGNLTVDGKLTANGLVIPVNYYAKYENWLSQAYINTSGSGASCSFQIYTENGSWSVRRESAGNVVSATGGNYTFLQCASNGNIMLGNNRTTINYSDGSITTPKVTQTSDERLKENISSISEDLDKIKDIEFFEFNLKNDKTKTKSYGVIAQDLEKFGLENLVVEDAKGYKAVDYTALIILELQRLRNEVKELKEKLNENIK